MKYKLIQSGLEYVLESTNVLEFEKTVTQHLKNGWELHGATFHAVRNNRIILMQALIRTESKQREK